MVVVRPCRKWALLGPVREMRCRLERQAWPVWAGGEGVGEDGGVVWGVEDGERGTGEF